MPGEMWKTKLTETNWNNLYIPPTSGFYLQWDYILFPTIF